MEKEVKTYKSYQLSNHWQCYHLSGREFDKHVSVLVIHQSKNAQKISGQQIQSVCIQACIDVSLHAVCAANAAAMHQQEKFPNEDELHAAIMQNR